jgi:glutamate racemase
MTKGDQRPIGIFDSGVGGLTVLKEIRERLPFEPTIYVADLLHFPYGPRYQDEVRGFAIDIIRYLESRDVKLVVIACNTATAAALNHARELFELPIIGVISPGAQAAVDTTKNNRIGVISTEGTMRSQEYLHAIKEIDPMVGVYQRACPELVEIVEAGEADSTRAEGVLRDDLADIVRLGADTLILGCTHYPHLKPAINRVYPGAFTLIDSATPTAAKVERHLDHSRLRATGVSPQHEVLVTDTPKHFDEIAANLFGDAIEAEEVEIWERQKT